MRYNDPENINDEATSIAVGGSENIYVTGFSGGVNDYDYTTIRYDAAGEQKWVARYNGPGNGAVMPTPSPRTAQAMSM